MKVVMQMRQICLVAGLSVACTAAYAQNTVANVVQDAPQDLPADSPYSRTSAMETQPLSYQHLREADVFFEKRIWRVIDVREKVNQAFSYPKAPFVSIIMTAAQQKELPLYSVVNQDSLKTRLSAIDINHIISQTDTIMVIDPVTFEEKITEVSSEISPDDIKRFRVKEAWIFDKQTSTLQCRILAIAPLREIKDEKGNFRYEQPMFWASYPQLRRVLAHKEVFNTQNDGQRMTWDDLFEMRMFSSYITKESNVHDRRIADYKQGNDALLESANIKNSIFNFEHDLWSY
jgi:gliding motility associated protien GldN